MHISPQSPLYVHYASLPSTYRGGQFKQFIGDVNTDFNNIQVREIFLHHRVVSNAEDALAPSAKGQRSLAIHQHAQPLTQLLHELGALNRHLDPRAPAARQLTVEQVPHAAPHRIELTAQLGPSLLPAQPPAGEVAVEEEAHCTSHWVVRLAVHRLAPRCE